MKLLGIFIESKGVIPGGLLTVRALQAPLGHLGAVIPYFNDIIG